MRTQLLLAVAAGCALTAGCSKPPEVALVSGVVQLDGKPLDGVLVAFNPDDLTSTTHPQASAFTDSKGAFQLRLPTGESGAVVGAYRITVFDPPKLGGSARKADANTQVPAGTAGAAPPAAATPSGVRPSRVPQPYLNWNTTPLRHTVGSGTNDVPVQLSSSTR